MTDGNGEHEISRRSKIELVLVISLCSLVVFITAASVKIALQGDRTAEQVSANASELKALSVKVGAVLNDHVSGRAMNEFLKELEEANPDLKVPRVVSWN